MEKGNVGNWKGDCCTDGVEQLGMAERGRMWTVDERGKKDSERA